MEIIGKKITINIPIGMEIDVEKSDLKAGVIMFRKKLLNYNDVWSSINTKDVYSKFEFFYKESEKARCNKPAHKHR